MSDNNTVHDHIYGIFKEEMLERARAVDGSLAALLVESDNEYALFRTVFRNFRISHGKKCGLRLTNYGLKLLLTEFEGYEVEITQNITPVQLLKLDDQMSWPYFVSHNSRSYSSGRKIVLFTAEDAGWLTLAAKDLDKFLEMI